MDGEYLDRRNERRADAAMSHAASHMRRAFDDRAFAAALGRTARQSVLTEFPEARVAERIPRRLDQTDSLRK